MLTDPAENHCYLHPADCRCDSCRFADGELTEEECERPIPDILAALKETRPSTSRISYDQMIGRRRIAAGDAK